MERYFWKIRNESLTAWQEKVVCKDVHASATALLRRGSISIHDVST
jgi:hypothetical protein